MSSSALSDAAGKPLLRGVSHQIGFFVAVVATAVLMSGVSGSRALVATAIFGASLSVQLGTSALYHRLSWQPAARQRMRRLDHATIFVLIAGGYTPLFTLVPSRSGGHWALFTMWACAGLGVLKSLLWVGAPKWVTALMCVGVGWIAVFEVLERTTAVGPLCIAVLVASGSMYSVGALVYALRRPDPFPKIFGYHEVFHAIVVLASVCLFAHVALVLQAIR
jgi:hemolysin III